jgi:hypothetical protein
MAKMAPTSLLIAFATCLVGYLSKTDPEKFRLDYFAYTMLISFVVGMATIAIKWDYGAIEQLLANGFATWWIWKAARIIAKKLGWIASPGPPSLPTA